MSMSKSIDVRSEVGRLLKILVHSPNSGAKLVAPEFQQELLFDDIVDFETMRQEYATYLETLYWFVDPQKAALLSKDQQERIEQLDPFSSPTPIP